MTSVSNELAFLDGAGCVHAHQIAMDIGGELGFWFVNNSGMADYALRARIPGLTNIIANTVGFGEDNVGIDIAAGSDARALQDLLDLGILRFAVATNYSDSRSPDVLYDSRLRHITGDLTSFGTWLKIVRSQRRYAPFGFAVAMHRPVGGLQDLPAATYQGAAQFMLDRVRSRGVMFTQIPRSIRHDRLAMNGMYRAIIQRGDIAEIITSPPAPEGTPVDWRDTYAILIKR